MSYGAPIRQKNFRGLETRRKESRNDNTALVFDNMEIRQAGTANKRHGIIRTVRRNFAGSVNAIIPTRHCYFLEEFIYGIDQDTPPPGEGLKLFVGPVPFGCGGEQPDPVTNLVVTPDIVNDEISLAWDLPKDPCISGVQITRKEEQPVVGPEDPDPSIVLIFFGAPKETHLDAFNIKPNIEYHYGVFTFFLQGA